MGGVHYLAEMSSFHKEAVFSGLSNDDNTPLDDITKVIVADPGMETQFTFMDTANGKIHTITRAEKKFWNRSDWLAKF